MVRRSSSQLQLGRYASPGMRGIVIAGAAAALTGCEDPEPAVGEVAAYSSTAQCIADDLVPNERCTEAEAQARAEHEESAPRYASWSDCQTDYEECDRTTGGGGIFFIPRFSGYLVAELIDEAGDYARKRRYRPVYRTRDGSIAVAGGSYVPGYGRFPVTRSGAEGLAARARGERFGPGVSQTSRYGGVGDQAARAAYGRSSGATTIGRSSVSRGGFGSGGFGRGG